MPSVTNESKDTELSDSKSSARNYSVISPHADENEEGSWGQTGEGKELELSVVGNPSNCAGMDGEFLLEDLKVFFFFF